MHSDQKKKRELKCTLCNDIKKRLSNFKKVIPVLYRGHFMFARHAAEPMV